MFLESQVSWEGFLHELSISPALSQRQLDSWHCYSTSTHLASVVDYLKLTMIIRTYVQRTVLVTGGDLVISCVMKVQVTRTLLVKQDSLCARVFNTAV